jgi:hypothetical protein
MYTSKDGNVYPAKQGGLRMNSELVVEVMTLVYKAMSEEERSDFQNSIEGIEDSDNNPDEGDGTEEQGE